VWGYARGVLVTNLHEFSRILFVGILAIEISGV